MRNCLAVILSFVMSTSAIAATKLDRIETASEGFVWNLAQHLSNELPEIEAIVPEIAWDDGWRQSAACILEGLAREKGNLWVGRYVREAEAFASKPIASTQDVRAAPEMLWEPVVAELAVSCGLLALALERAGESGLLEALTTTDLAAKLEALP